MFRRHAPLLPFLAVLLGVALYSVMDGFMKYASLAAGAYGALLWRNIIGSALMIPVWQAMGGTWPNPPVLRLHVLRGTINAVMALTFFMGLTHLPLAEAIAISFFAPLIALYLAAMLLGERISRPAIHASVLGLAGVIVIAAARIGKAGSDTPAAIGIALVLVSACLYAWNLVLQRQLAQLADPREVASFHQGVGACVLLPGLPWFAAWPHGTLVWLAIGASALLSVLAMLTITWGYRRAEAQALVPLEYSAFIWAALFGWLAFGETLTIPTLLGTVLIVLACWTAAPRRRTESTAA
jgi:S-adenosylmethionine uptake transporter